MYHIKCVSSRAVMFVLNFLSIYSSNSNGLMFFLSYCHHAGSVVVQALLQLEQHMGSSPEARHLPTNFQRPRSSRWRCSVLPSAQQRRYCAARHQHLQPLCRSGLAHRGLFSSYSYIYIYLGLENFIFKGERICSSPVQTGSKTSFQA